MHVMGGAETMDARGALTSTLDWWRDAGVDMLVDDEPRDWLARRVTNAPAQAAEPAVASAPPEVLPETLDAFVEWRMGDAAPEREWLAALVPPAGPAGGLMVLTDMPEAGDETSGVLLSGAPGRLLDRMLASIGESRESVHIASIAAARPLTGQIPPEQEARLAALALHHIALVAPEKLLILGQAAKRVLDTTSGSGDGNSLIGINLLDRPLEIVASSSPRFLMERPARKAQAWKDLLQLSRGTSQ